MKRIMSFDVLRIENGYILKSEILLDNSIAEQIYEETLDEIADAMSSIIRSQISKKDEASD